MIRANFFYKFFKSKQNRNNDIVKFNSNKKFELEKEINTKILEINQTISENSAALIQAQIVKFRTTFSQSNNFLEKIGKNVYNSKLDDSINWHQKNLKELYVERRRLESILEKMQGIFWINRIKKFLTILLLVVSVLFSLLIFVSGFMMLIYSLPLILLIFFGYLMMNKKY